MLKKILTLKGKDDMTSKEQLTKTVLSDCCEITEMLHKGLDFVERIKVTSICDKTIDVENFKLILALGDWLRYKTLDYIE